MVITIQKLICSQVDFVHEKSIFISTKEKLKGWVKRENNKEGIKSTGLSFAIEGIKISSDFCLQMILHQLIPQMHLRMMKKSSRNCFEGKKFEWCLKEITNRLGMKKYMIYKDLNTFLTKHKTIVKKEIKTEDIDNEIGHELDGSENSNSDSNESQYKSSDSDNSVEDKPTFKKAIKLEIEESKDSESSSSEEDEACNENPIKTENIKKEPKQEFKEEILTQSDESEEVDREWSDKEDQIESKDQNKYKLKPRTVKKEKSNINIISIESEESNDSTNPVTTTKQNFIKEEVEILELSSNTKSVPTKKESKEKIQLKLTKVVCLKKLLQRKRKHKLF